MSLTNFEDSLVVQMGKAKMAYEEAKEVYEELAQRARAELAPTTHTDGLFEVVIGPNRIWNKDKARENYGDAVCTLQVDLKKAREVMTGEQFESFYVEMAPKVTTRLVKAS